MKNVSSKIDAAVKQKFLDDLIYIIEQAILFQRYQDTCAHADLRNSSLQKGIHNAILESSLAFFRKANEFFGCIKDIKASDYIPSWEQTWILDSHDKKLLDDRVMHISLAEANHGKQDWGEFFRRNLPKLHRISHQFYLELKSENSLTPKAEKGFANCFSVFALLLLDLPLNSNIIEGDGDYLRKKE